MGIPSPVVSNDAKESIFDGMTHGLRATEGFTETMEQVVTKRNIGIMGAMALAAPEIALAGTAYFSTHMVQGLAYNKEELTRLAGKGDW